MGQFMDSEATVADEDDLTTWQPARQLQCALSSPVRQQFVTTAALKLDRCEGASSVRTGNALIRLVHETGVSTMKLNQRSPLALTKWPWLERTGSRYIPRALIRRPPSTFNGVVHANDHRAGGHEVFDHNAQQSPGNSKGAPAGAAEDLMIACKVGGLSPAGQAQAGSDGSLARRQQRTHHQNKHMLPAGGRETGAPRL